MNINIECENEYNDWKLNLDDIKKTARLILEFLLKQDEIKEKYCLKDYEYDKISLDFLFCGSGNTHALNLEYRSKNYPADIITFAVFADSEEDERFVLDGEINLGEIIIALDKMIEGAKEKDIPKENELAFFIAHGIMHLLGFDHQTQEDYNFVIEQQKKALESIDIIYDKI